MKHRLNILIALLLLSGSACTKEKAKVTFRNNSTSSSTYTVVWDGSAITTLQPFTTSQEFEEEPGQHTLLFKKSNTGTNACSQSTPVLDEGSSRQFSCSY